MPRDADSPLIVDTHMHLGPCDGFDLNVEEAQIAAVLDEGAVDAVIVQPFPGAPDAAAVHDRIAALARRYPQRVFGIASINPHLGEAVYLDEVRRCVTELGFVGLKLHTIGHAVNPQHRAGRMVFEAAAQLGVPAMVHTGTGAPFALPSMVLPVARDYPELPIVLAHAGYAMYTPEAMAVASVSPSLYLETSWSTSLQLGGMVKSLGAERVMYGSDLLANIPVELAKYHSIVTDREQLRQTLGGTAQRVFGLELGQAA
jgi:predicted TIM-barrel fold metal-dependent hydrolase